MARNFTRFLLLPAAALLLGLSQVSAQDLNYTGGKNVTITTYEPFDSFGVGNIVISNKAAKIVKIDYKLLSNTMNTAWSLSLCDVEQCLPYVPVSGTCQMDANDTRAFSLKVKPYDASGKAVQGTGTIKILVTEQGSTTGDTLTFTANALKLGILQPSQAIEKVSVYPNPATSFINLSGLANGFRPNEFALYNIAGQKVAGFSEVTNRLDVSSLPSGLYLVHMTDRNGRAAVSSFEKE